MDSRQMRKLLTKRLLLFAVAVPILLSGSACENVRARPSEADWINPFCLIGPPPPELIPAESEPFGWMDAYLAVDDAECPQE